ncbi:MAG TPA: sigma-70 family RNA polymerase sigma factor [Pyrinomonadaceae bacterium]
MSSKNKKKSECTWQTDLELFRRYKDGDCEALRILLESHYGLIKFWARQLLLWADHEEILEEGRIGLYKAIKSFRISDNIDFHTHARNFVRKAIYNSAEVRRVKRTLYDNYGTVLSAQDKLMRDLNRKPTIEEISDETKLSVRQVNNALNVIAAFPSPLNEANGQFALEDPYQTQLIRDALNQLSSPDAQLIVHHHLYGYTDREIGAALGRSNFAIKMARTRAEVKLKAIISGQGTLNDGKRG